MQCISKRWLFRQLSILIFIMPQAVMGAEAFINETYVQSFLKGYAAEEVTRIDIDLKNIRALCFREVTPLTFGKRTYIATAGGPGASKSTILEHWLEENKNFAYLDPDQRALKYMIHTYLQEFSNRNISHLKVHTRSDWENLLERAYTKWRGASNYIATTLLNEAFSHGDNIAHGTTSTSEQVEGLYQKLTGNGYKIILLLCYASDEHRVNAVMHRAKNQNFVQTSAEDTIQKGKLFPERFPIYFKYADEMQLYWTDPSNLEHSTLAATLRAGKGMVIHDENAMKKFTAQYNLDSQGKEWKALESYIKDFEQGHKQLR